jgi:hypothetical protein
VSAFGDQSADGHEGFLGLEAGIMTIGLANETGDTGRSITQVGAVGGLGISVPIANRASPTQASINPSRLVRRAHLGLGLRLGAARGVHLRPEHLNRQRGDEPIGVALTGLHSTWAPQ